MRRLKSTMTGASAGVAWRMVTAMVASSFWNPYAVWALPKPGKLPYRTHALQYDLEYGSAELQVHTDGVPAGAHVLLVDDLLATGGTMHAACTLIEKAGGHIVGCAFLVELLFLKGRDKLKPHEVFSLIKY